MGYESDLTDNQWALIEEFFEARKGRHFRKHDNRMLVNAVLYRIKTGCQWRYLPKDYPSWKTVFSFYNRACDDGIWERGIDGGKNERSETAYRNRHIRESAFRHRSCR